jgi:plastocyanin
MRRFVLSAIAALALVVPAASHPAVGATTKGVRITATGFTPATVYIATGDSVKWTNRDTKNHQVVANNGAFVSAIITPGHAYTHTFNTSGTYRYHDALHPALTGKVVVTGPAPAVTIGATAPILVFGQETHISGQISNHAAGETVTVWQQPYTEPSATLLATVMTGANGVWDVIVKPNLLTSYSAHWKATVSSTVQVAVHPKVSFTLRRGHGLVRVRAARSMAGRKVYIQRLTRFHEWVKIRRLVLNSSSSRAFRFHPKRGRYVLRAYMTVNQAGAGYLDGTSRTIVLRQR